MFLVLVVSASQIIVFFIIIFCFFFSFFFSDRMQQINGSLPKLTSVLQTESHIVKWIEDTHDLHSMITEIVQYRQ